MRHFKDGACIVDFGHGCTARLPGSSLEEVADNIMILIRDGRDKTRRHDERKALLMAAVHAAGAMGFTMIWKDADRFYRELRGWEERAA